MRGINKVFLMGNLGATPELRTTRSGKNLAELSLATNRSRRTDDGWEDKTDWHRVTLWEHDADLACRFLVKGSPVAVEGEMRTDTWMDKATGQKRYKTYVLGKRLHLIGKPRHEQATDAPDPRKSAAPVAEEEIPF